MNKKLTDIKKFIRVVLNLLVVLAELINLKKFSSIEKNNFKQYYNKHLIPGKLFPSIHSKNAPPAKDT